MGRVEERQREPGEQGESEPPGPAAGKPPIVPPQPGSGSAPDDAHTNPT